MSAKQNKMPGWKEDFLQWERSGAPANDMLWEKLQTRLQSRRKKTLIYLLPAAAVLLLILGLGYFFFINNKRPDGSTAKTPGVPVKTIAPVAKSSVAPINSIKKSLPREQNDKQQKKITVYVNNSDPVLLPEKIVPSVPVVPIEPKQLIVDTLKPIIAEAPKKKLKVVHMNEWNAPPPPTYAAIKEAWENEAKQMQQEIHEPDQPVAPNKRWSIFSPRN